MKKHCIFLLVMHAITALIIAATVCSCGQGYAHITYDSDYTAEIKLDTVNGKKGIVLYFESLPSELTVPRRVQGYDVIRLKFADATDYAKVSSITMGDGIMAIDSLQGFTSLTDVVFPRSLVSFPVCKGCTRLASADVPDGVNQLSAETFSGCTALTEVTLGSGITEIGAQAFLGCTSLKTLNCTSQTPPTVAADAFVSAATSSATDLRSRITLHVTQSALDAYQNDDYWKEFNFEESEDDDA